MTDQKHSYWTIGTAIKEAEKIGVEVSRPTLIRWIRVYGLGFQLGGEGGKWYVFPNKFKRYINGGQTETGKNPTIKVIQSDEEESTFQE